LEGWLWVGRAIREVSLQQTGSTRRGLCGSSPGNLSCVEPSMYFQRTETTGYARLSHDVILVALAVGRRKALQEVSEEKGEYQAMLRLIECSTLKNAKGRATFIHATRPFVSFWSRIGHTVEKLYFMRISFFVSTNDPAVSL
jgi:hypothetical protein